MASILALDVGTKRVGIAAADTVVPIAMPLVTLDVDGTEFDVIRSLINDRGVNTVVVGYPRNQAGDPTEQTTLTENFVTQLKGAADIVYQDESLTSVMAEEKLKSSGKPYEKADIDALAAALILQDYLETHHAA